MAPEQSHYCRNMSSSLTHSNITMWTRQKIQLDFHRKGYNSCKYSKEILSQKKYIIYNIRVIHELFSALILFSAISAVTKIIRFRRSEYSYKALLNITPGEIKVKYNDTATSARSINQFQLFFENHITAL